MLLGLVLWKYRDKTLIRYLMEVICNIGRCCFCTMLHSKPWLENLKLTFHEESHRWLATIFKINTVKLQIDHMTTEWRHSCSRREPLIMKDTWRHYVESQNCEDVVRVGMCLTAVLQTEESTTNKSSSTTQPLNRLCCYMLHICEGRDLWEGVVWDKASIEQIVTYDRGYQGNKYQVKYMLIH